MVTKFTFLGGALCLDFANTVSGHEGTAVIREKLSAPGDLKRWAELAGLPSGTITRRMLRRAIEFREAFFRICKAAIDSKAPSPADLDVFNRELIAARSEERLHYSRGAFRIGSETVLAAVVRSAADLLTSPDQAKLRQCGGDECGWLFLDTSRNRSRQWCDMRVCGNRAKARAFRQRSRPKNYSKSREA
jgi:predicted RNA-binding Zn ribbon-like protein